MTEMILFHQISSKDALDVLADRNRLFAKYLTFEQVAGVTGYVWTVDGQFRTVTTNYPMAIDGTALSLGTRYKIVNRKGHTGFGDCIGESLRKEVCNFSSCMCS